MVDLESEGGVARIFLNRPEKVNALHSPLLAALGDAFNRVSDAPDLRVVVLGGHGKAFCGGADVSELSAFDASSAPRFICCRGSWARAARHGSCLPAKRSMRAGRTPGV